MDNTLSQEFYVKLFDIINDSPLELIQIRIDELYNEECSNIIDSIIKNSPIDLIQTRIDEFEKVYR